MIGEEMILSSSMINVVSGSFSHIFFYHTIDFLHPSTIGFMDFKSVLQLTEKGSGLLFDKFDVGFFQHLSLLLKLIPAFCNAS